MTAQSKTMTPLLIVKRLTPLFFTIVSATSFTFKVHTLTTITRPVSTGSSFVLKGSASDDVYTVQILMSDTGGGHRASANALRDAFEVLHPGKIACDIVDIYTDYGPWPYNSYVQGYKLMAANPWMWDVFYQFGATELGMWLNEFLLEIICFDPFLKCLARPSGGTARRADMVISVHPLTQGLPLKILSTLDSGTRDISKRTTPFCTVVTDLGSAHPTWFHPGVDKCFVPSDALNNFALKRGLQPSQIVQHGLPIRRGFWATNNTGKSTVDKAPLRRKLGLDADLPVVLVVGGGDGMGGIVDIARQLGAELGKAETKSQMVVVCGNNKDAKSQLDSHLWGEDVDVIVQGFVNNMDEWMKASDALVTKAGPGTIAEASICGLPCMMFSFLPGQEEGNISFVEDAGFGKYNGDPVEIGKIVGSWLSNPEKLDSMQKAALAASRPKATLDIARDLADLLFAHKQAQQPKETVKVSRV